ncbi:MAG TPA: ATPase, partial [Rhizobiaceae bacterium]|nr:ATPase [Rhizobiaceae bacterium]
FLSSLGQREAIAFGEGVAATMRLKFEQLPEAMIPGSTDVVTDERAPGADDVDLAAIVERLRNVSRTIQPPAMTLGSPVPAQAQAGDNGYRPARSINEFQEEPGRFGRRLTDYR